MILKLTKDSPLMRSLAKEWHYYNIRWKVYYLACITPPLLSIVGKFYMDFEISGHLASNVFTACITFFFLLYSFIEAFVWVIGLLMGSLICLTEKTYWLYLILLTAYGMIFLFGLQSAFEQFYQFYQHFIQYHGLHY